MKATQRVRKLSGKVAAMAAGLALLIQAPALAQGYALGPNDSINVVVYGQGEFNVQTRVKPDGSIVMPLIGKVSAEGKTVITLADEITKRLVSGNYLRDPIVNVEVTDYASRYVRVAGKVGSPGLVPLDRTNNLLDILLRSGWVSDAGSEFATIRRADSNKEERINVQELARGTIPAVFLKSGDTVFVANAEVVYLAGAAARPGTYPLKDGMTMGELLAMAGGVGPTGSSNKFSLTREGQKKDIDIDKSFELQAGDMITVRERLF